MKSVFPSNIDGDLLNLVHLSNGFRMVEGAKPLQVGDVCRSEARIVSVVNNDSGKVVKVKGHVYRDGEAVIEVTSSFLYRGRFVDYHNTFEVTEEPEYLVALETDTDVGVLQSKGWFDWNDPTKPLQAGTSLYFHIQSQVSFKDKATCSNVVVTGEVFVKDQLKRLILVGPIKFEDDCRGNPVLAYLQRHGSAQGIQVPLANGGYTLTTRSESTLFHAPLSNEPYSKIHQILAVLYIISCYCRVSYVV